MSATTRDPGFFTQPLAERDPELAFPLTRLHELAADGVVGEVGPRHATCMGSITATGRLVRDTAPEIARTFTDDQVAKFKEPGTEVMLKVAHEKYGHIAILPDAVKEALAGDFD